MPRFPGFAAAAAACVLPMSASAETLADAIATAYRTNPTLQSGRYDVRAADEEIVQARSELRPSGEFTANGSESRSVEGRATRNANPFASTSFNRNNLQTEISLSQPIYTGGRATADRLIADADIRTARERLRSTEGDLLLSVIQAYVDVRRYQATLSVWRESVTELEKIAGEVDARRTAGELTRTDLAQVESQLALTREQALLAEQNLADARSSYAALVGRDPGGLEEEPALPNLPSDVGDAFDLAQELSPELAQSRYAERGSRAQILSARAEGMPTLSLRGSASTSGKLVPYVPRDQDKDYAASLVLTVPFTAGGRIASRIRQAEARNDSDRLKIEQERRQVMRAVSSAWNQCVASLRSQKLFEEQRRAALVQLDGMISEYRVGLRSTFDVLYAQQTLRDAEVQLLSSKRDAYVAQASLLRQIGRLEVAAMESGVALYRPGQHLRDVENDHALPWEATLAALDRPGKRAMGQQGLAQPPLLAATPKIAPFGPVPAGSSFTHSLPMAPIGGTVGVPSNQTVHHGG